MIAIYLAALLAALGVFALQLTVGHHDVGGGGHDAGHDGGAWSLFASTRFWTFGLLAFGLVGTLLTALSLAGRVTTGLVAAGAGVASGLFAATVMKRLSHQVETSHGTAGDVVGRVGRVVVPLEVGGPGKVRIDVKGSEVDYVARSRDRLVVDDAVIVEECDGSEVVVSRAPKELKS